MIQLEAYVLNTKTLSKNDVMITLISTNGIITIFGRGYLNLKHKFHVMINRGLKVKIYGVQKKTYFQLYDYDLLSNNLVVTLDVDKYEQYVKIIKLVLYIEHLLDDVAFTLFDFCVTEIENYNTQLLIDLWKVYILKKENVFLNFTKCVKCGRDNNFITLSLTDGGLICSNCYTNQVILSIEDIKALNAFYQTKINLLKCGYNKNVSVFLTELIEHNIGLKID